MSPLHSHDFSYSVWSEQLLWQLPRFHSYFKNQCLDRASMLRACRYHGSTSQESPSHLKLFSRKSDVFRSLSRIRSQWTVLVRRPGTLCATIYSYRFYQHPCIASLDCLFGLPLRTASSPTKWERIESSNNFDAFGRSIQSFGGCQGIFKAKYQSSPAVTAIIICFDGMIVCNCISGKIHRKRITNVAVFTSWLRKNETNIPVSWQVKLRGASQ